jgi:DNA-binding HxlR family transcriptional regulator
MVTEPCRDVDPLQALLASISNKWVTTVLQLLSDATELNYGELQRRTNAVSRKMLSATLRNLVRDGLVQRRPASDGGSRRVYYRITDLGRSLVATLNDLRTWADANMDVVDAARRTYDRSAN